MADSKPDSETLLQGLRATIATATWSPELVWSWRPIAGVMRMVLRRIAARASVRRAGVSAACRGGLEDDGRLGNCVGSVDVEVINRRGEYCWWGRTRGPVYGMGGSFHAY